MNPIVTVRFQNPVYNPEEGTYTVDVRFKCNVPNEKLYGINLRFYTDISQLLFLEIIDLAAGYSKMPPNPPMIEIGNDETKEDFGFDGPEQYVNGAVVCRSPSLAPVLPSDGKYVTLFRLKFNVAEGYTPTAPPLVWDKKLNPADGGLHFNSSGVVMTLVAPSPQMSKSADEAVRQFNWTYNENPLPWGEPI